MKRTALIAVLAIGVTQPLLAKADQTTLTAPRAISSTELTLTSTSAMPYDRGSRMRSPGLVVSGSVLAALGLGASIAGAVFLANTKECTAAAPEGYLGPTCSSYTDMNRFYGWTSLGAGAAFLLGGVTMIVVGAWQVPVWNTPVRAQLGFGPTDAHLKVSF